MTDGSEDPAPPANLLGEQILELKDGLNTFQSSAFESLYDKKVQWAKDDIQPTESAAETIENSIAVQEDKKIENPDDIIDEAPVARKRTVESSVVVAKPAVMAPVKEVTVEPAVAVREPLVAPPAATAKAVIVEEKNVEITAPIAITAVKAVLVEEKNVEITVPVAMKKAVGPEVKKAGGFFGFLQSDSAVQQIANTNKPTQPPAIAKAFMTPTPAEITKEVKKEAPVRKSKEGLNMVMYKQDEDSAEKKAMMSSRPSLADFKATAAKDAADEEEEEEEEEEIMEAKVMAKVPTGAPIKVPAPVEPKSGGMFSFLTPPATTKLEAPVMKPAPAPIKTVSATKQVDPAPKENAVVQAPPPKKPAAPGGFFNFLTSDPSLVAPGDANAKPSGPPAVARAFMAPTPAESRKEGEVMSAAALIRQAEFEQDVKDEEIKSAMMAVRPSIGAARAEASKTPSKAEIRAAEAKAAGRVIEAPAKPSGLFDFFSLDQGASGGDIFEPRDPNALTAKEESAFSAPPPVKAKAVAPVAKKAVSAPAPAPITKVPVVKAESPAGGLFGFLNPGSTTTAKETAVTNVVKKAVPAVTKAAPAVAKRVVESPVVSATSKTSAAPSGGVFGFLNQAPAKTAPVVVKVETPPPVVKSAPAPSGGVFGFLNSTPPPAKQQQVVPLAKKIPAPAVTTKATVSAPVISASKDSAPGGFFSFLNSSPPAPKAAASVKPVAATKPVAVAKPVAVTKPVAVAKPVAVTKPVAVAKPVAVTKPVAVAKPVAAVGMNTKFLASISKLLKGDANKIKAFQAATDSFRSGDILGEVFLKTLENLFGIDNLESVVIPLVSELPERAVATKLKAAYEKRAAAMKKANEPAKAPFSFSFGTPPAKKVVPAPVPVVVAPAPKKEGFSFPTFGSAPPAKKVVPAPVPVVVAPAPKKEGFSFPTFGSAPPAKKVTTAAVVPVIKSPSSVPVSKRGAVESQIKQLLSEAIDAKIFYKNVSKDLGRPKTLEVMPEIIKSLPKPVGIKVETVFKSDK